MVGRKLFGFILFLFYFVFFVRCDEDGALISVDSGTANDGQVANEGDEILIISDEIFRATTEWQEVKPGQAIPRGLHVRLNMANGKREAKINEDSRKTLRHLSDEGVLNSDHKPLTISQIKQALSQMDKQQQFNGEIVLDESKFADVQSKYRSYEELKKDFEALNVNVRTDLEILTGLITEYRHKDCSNERKLAILEELEYLLHQIDNAHNFVDMGGLTIVKESMNSSDSKFRALGAFILGSACQSNPKVQIAAVDNGVLHLMLHLFVSEGESEVRKKMLFALSSLLRHFPHAQKKFLDLGGMEVFNTIFREKGDQREKLKVATLMYDLLHEREEVELKTNSRSEAAVEKLRQYRAVPFLESLMEAGHCENIAELVNVVSNLDEQEKILKSYHVMMNQCIGEFEKHEAKLTEFIASYHSLLRENEGDEYFGHLLNLAEEIQAKIRRHTEL